MNRPFLPNISMIILIIFSVIMFPVVDAKSCEPNSRLKAKHHPGERAAQRQYYYTKVLATGDWPDKGCFDPEQLSLFRSIVMASHQSAITNVTLMTCRWWHYQRVGSKFKHQKRCIKNTTIYGNARSVQAMTVDECDSTMGWDKDHDFQPPCDVNIINASRAVWEARGMPKSKRGTVDIYWSDS